MRFVFNFVARITLTVFLTVTILSLTGCKPSSVAQKKIDSIIIPPVLTSKTKELVVLTHNGPSTYFIDGTNNYSGLEYDLAKLFAADLGAQYKVKFVVVDNVTEIIPALLKGKAHFAAASLSITPIRQQLVKFSTPYKTVQQQVAYNTKNPAPRKIADLFNKSIYVPAGTSFAERLDKLSKQEPKLHWHADRRANSDELLEQVADGTLDLTVADDYVIALMQNLQPNLGAGMALGEPEKIAWAFPKNGEPGLLKKADTFFAKISKDGTLRNLIDRYYGHSERLKTVDATTYISNIRTLLPQYIQLFKEAGELTDIDWRLLAALSYQESHWDTYNTSPTNVRGLMMLTESTADRMGVTDRLDPKQSIKAGAKYINLIREDIPKRVPEPDRTWMALAAYNIGGAHVEDARVLAQRMKLNPDAWADVKKMLPLLNNYDYYSTVKYGYASGGAPVVFVESIRSYYQILQQQKARNQIVLPNFK